MRNVRAAKVCLAGFLAVALATGVLGATSCAHVSPGDRQATRGAVPGSGGVSLARDWVQDLALGNVSPPMTWANADRRYLKLAGGTMAGDLIMNAAGSIYLSSFVNGARLSSTGASVLINAGGFQFVYNAGDGSFTSPASNVATTYMRSIGVASGSLPTCNSGMYGANENDTTRKSMVQCQGGSLGALDAWRPHVVASTGAAGYNQNTFLGRFESGDIVSPEATDYMGIGWYGELADNVQVLKGATSTISCSFETTGVVGGAVTGVVMELTDATNLCTCTLTGGTAVCGAAVRTNVSCDCTWSGTAGQRISVSTAGNKGIKLQMKNTTDCGTNPRNVKCSAYTNAGPI